MLEQRCCIGAIIQLLVVLSLPLRHIRAHQGWTGPTGIGAMAAVWLLEIHWCRSAQDQWEPWDMRASHSRPHLLQQAETAMFNVLGKTRGKDACKDSSLEREWRLEVQALMLFS